MRLARSEQNFRILISAHPIVYSLHGAGRCGGRWKGSVEGSAIGSERAVKLAAEVLHSTETGGLDSTMTRRQRRPCCRPS